MFAFLHLLHLSICHECLLGVFLPYRLLFLRRFSWNWDHLVQRRKWFHTDIVSIFLQKQASSCQATNCSCWRWTERIGAKEKNTLTYYREGKNRLFRHTKHQTAVPAFRHLSKIDKHVKPFNWSNYWIFFWCTHLLMNVYLCKPQNCSKFDGLLRFESPQNNKNKMVCTQPWKDASRYF